MSAQLDAWNDVKKANPELIDRIGRVSGIERMVCNDIERRQQLGLAKYGVSVADNNLGLIAWLQHAYEEALEFFKGRNWLTEHQAEFDMAKQRVFDQRMIDLVLSDKTARASDHLSREFFRTLAELRNQQDWRRKTQVIDVTPDATNS